MGNWSTAISSNDTFEDIYDEFFELYNDGLAPDEITVQLITQHQELINDYADQNNFWFALGLAQWECKSLQPDIFNKISTIIESGNDLKIWEELGASRRDLTKRSKALDRFLAKLKTEKNAPKKRKRKILRDSIFKKGDCLTFELKDGSFGTAVVLESEIQTEFGMNLIALCDLAKPYKPKTDEIFESNILILREEKSPGKIEDREAVSWFYAQFYKKANIKIHVIDNIEITRSYNFEKHYRIFSNWDTLPRYIEQKEERYDKFGKPNKNVELKRLVTEDKQ